MAASPDFFIVGAPKCGTTAMFTYLGAHPEVFTPSRKEPSFFGRDLRPLGYDMDAPPRVAAYHALFDGRTTEKRAGEASPWYLYSATAAEEIARYCPDARIVAMLRDPVEMMYSAYYMFQKRNAPTPHGVVVAGTHRVLSFEEALETQEERRRELEALRRAGKVGAEFSPLFHTDIACYAPQVARYLDTFGRERVHVVLFDAFKRDTAGEYRRVLEFLGVDPTFRPPFEVVNANQRIRSHWLHRSLRTGDTLVPLRGVMRAVVPVKVRKSVARRLVHWNLVEKPRPPMAPTTAAWLRGVFEPDIDALGALLGMDLRSLWLGERRGRQWEHAVRER